MGRTVYASSTTQMNSGPRRYHTDRECPRLSKANSVTEKDLALVADHWEECSFCAGEDKYGGAREGSFDVYNALEAADPDTPLGGGR